MGGKNDRFKDRYEEHYMNGFLFRLLRHDFVVSYIDDFFSQDEKTYYSFFMLMKVLGIHKELKFQTNYWSDCYIYFYEVLGVHGILFIPLLLSQGTIENKKQIIKKYLNEHINHTKEHLNSNSNLVMNLIDFKKVILTYFSCVSTRALENVLKIIEDKYKIGVKNKNDINRLRKIYSNQNVESFVDTLLRPYSRQNYFVDAGRFIDDNIIFLTNDKKIRERLKEFNTSQEELEKKLKFSDNVNQNKGGAKSKEFNKINKITEELSELRSESSGGKGSKLEEIIEQEQKERSTSGAKNKEKKSETEQSLTFANWDMPEEDTIKQLPQQMEGNNKKIKKESKNNIVVVGEKENDEICSADLNFSHHQEKIPRKPTGAFFNKEK